MVRIRKSLQSLHVSPLIYCSNAAPEDFQPHICRLNQSGWDVSPLPELDDEDGLNLNKSGSGTIRATKSVVLPSERDVNKVIIDIEEGSKEVGFDLNCSVTPSEMGVDKVIIDLEEGSKDVGFDLNCSVNPSEMDVDKVIIDLEEGSKDIGFDLNCSGAPSEMDVDKVIIDVEEGSEEVGERNETVFKKQKICKKNDGKGWNCKRTVEEGYSFCKHHLTLIRTYHNNSSNNAPKSIPLKKPKVARGKAPEAKVEKGSCKSGDCVNYLDSKLVPNMDRMAIEEEETTMDLAVECGAGTSSAITVTLENDPPSAKVDYENQLANVEVKEVKVDGSNVSGRKRSRKMKNPKRARIFSPIFPTEP